MFFKFLLSIEAVAEEFPFKIENLHFTKHLEIFSVPANFLRSEPATYYFLPTKIILHPLKVYNGESTPFLLRTLPHSGREIAHFFKWGIPLAVKA